MKPHPPSHPARTAGTSLIECLVYIAVFGLLLGLATAAFYFCWDNTRAMMGTTDKIEAALRAGERWRADVRSATGPVSVEWAGDSETVRIPEGSREIVYHFNQGTLRREQNPSASQPFVLEAVRASAMYTESRNGVIACRWELELAPVRKAHPHPLRFTFEAAPVQP